MALSSERIQEIRPRLVHEAYAMLLARAAKYDDQNNLEWEWKDADRWERHAINAALDLRDARAEVERLRNLQRRIANTCYACPAEHGVEDAEPCGKCASCLVRKAESSTPSQTSPAPPSITFESLREIGKRAREVGAVRYAEAFELLLRKFDSGEWQNGQVLKFTFPSEGGAASASQPGEK